MPSARLIAWIDADQELLLREVVELAGLELVAVGSGSTDTGALAQTLGTEPLRDLRAAAQHGGADVVWVAAASGPGDAVPRNGAAVWMSTEPGAVFVPLLRLSPGFAAAREILPELGDVTLANVSLLSGSGTGSLTARLFDGFDLIDVLCGQPETLDAAIVPASGRGPVESLVDLDGHASVNLRFADRRCATLAASNRAAGWSRRVTLVGEHGTLRFDDHTVDWSEAEDGPEAIETGPRPAALIARQIRRTLEHLDDAEPPPVTDRLLAWCEATRLSSRTGENEVPGNVMEMLNRV